MGMTIGLPCLKLNNVGKKSKHCGSFEKVSGEALDRNGTDKDIDAAKSDLNEYRGFQTSQELREYSANHIKEMTDKLRSGGKRGIRVDAVAMCVTVIKPPAFEMNKMSPMEQDKFINDSIDIFSEIVGKERIKSVAIHRDELGIHAHVFWEPMTKDGRLSAKEEMNLKFFAKLNKEMPDKMRAKGWEQVMDCKAYDQAEELEKREALGEDEYKRMKVEEARKKGQSSLNFKAGAEEKRKEIVEEIKDFEEYSVELKDEVATRANKLMDLDSDIEKKERKVKVLDQQLSQAEQQLTSTRTSIQKAEQILDKQYEKLDAVNAELEKNLNFLDHLKHTIEQLKGITKEIQTKLMSKVNDQRHSLEELLKTSSDWQKAHPHVPKIKSPKDRGFER